MKTSLYYADERITALELFAQKLKLKKLNNLSLLLEACCFLSDFLILLFIIINLFKFFKIKAKKGLTSYDKQYELYRYAWKCND